MATFGIADCNNFYVSCERVFRPQLEERPVIVMSNNDGCVIARSNEVKALGIAMGAPIHTIRHLIQKHHIQIYSANFALYGDLSQRVMQVLESFTNLEIYSIDEAFLDFAPIPRAERSTAARHIRASVRQQTGIPLSIGIAPTKTLAKLANDRAKKLPEGVLEVATPADIDVLLQSMEVEDVWGIGHRRAEWLRKHQVMTAYDLKQADTAWVKRHLHVPVARTVWELRGVSCLPLDEVREPKQEICTSRSFSRQVETIEDLREAVATYTTRAAEKLRNQHSHAGIITVFLHTNPFQPEQPQYAAHCAVPLTPTSDTRDLIRAAIRGLEACYKSGYRYHKAGVILAQLTPDHLIQPSLFGEETSPERQQLQVVIDTINRKWGRDTIRYAASGIARPWQMKQEHRTPRYTSRWDELLSIHEYPFTA
jgi:DNA polymerase V